MNVNNIKKIIGTNSMYTDIIFMESVSSTNTLLKDMAKEGCTHGTVLIANQQTSGRGRLGRKFYSPQSTGLYFSILLRPSLNAENALFFTTAAAVAVAKSIEDLTGKKADIKWVNDIYINDKKVSGILTEGAVNSSGNLEYAIIGIGINVSNPSNQFPLDLRDIAGAIYDNSNIVDDVNITKNVYNSESANIYGNIYVGNSSNIDNTFIINIKEKLCASILNIFEKYYESLPEKIFLEEYKKRSFLIGKEIYILSNDSKTPGTVMEIDDECHLIVQKENGEVIALSSGEVSVRLKNTVQ